MAEDYYKILGIEQGATAAEVKAAYRKLAAKYHPDQPDGDLEKMQTINNAYDTLKDPDKRSFYDHSRKTQQSFHRSASSGAHSSSTQYDFDQRMRDVEEMLRRAQAGGQGRRSSHDGQAYGFNAYAQPESRLDQILKKSAQDISPKDVSFLNSEMLSSYTNASHKRKISAAAVNWIKDRADIASIMPILAISSVKAGDSSLFMATLKAMPDAFKRQEIMLMKISVDDSYNNFSVRLSFAKLGAELVKANKKLAPEMTNMAISCVMSLGNDELFKAITKVQPSAFDQTDITLMKISVDETYYNFSRRNLLVGLAAGLVKEDRNMAGLMSGLAISGVARCNNDSLFREVLKADPHAFKKNDMVMMDMHINDSFKPHTVRSTFKRMKEEVQKGQESSKGGWAGWKFGL